MEKTTEESSGNFAWNASFFGAIFLLVLLPVIKPDVFLEIYRFIPDGLISTLVVTLASIVIASVISIAVGVGRVLHPALNKILSIYVEVVRGIPLFVQLFYVYFVLGSVLPLPRIVAAIAAMSLCYGAYMAEIVRAGIISISKSQIEAALSLGMGRFQAFRYVIIPQALRVILPPFGNEYIMLLKDSSLISVIAVTDIMQRTRQYATRTFNYFEAFTVCALVYLVLTLLFSKIVYRLEKRFSRQGSAAAAPSAASARKNGKISKTKTLSRRSADEHAPDNNAPGNTLGGEK